MIFESFHHHAKVPMSDRALLTGFLMLWLKRCVVPTLPYEVMVADMVYPTILLAHGKFIALLPVMMVRIQSGLRALMKSFCQVKAIVDAEGNPVTDSNGYPLVKTPSPRVELPYTFMHCPSIMTAVLSLKVLHLSCSGWRVQAGCNTIYSTSGRLF